ncbi:hypothetical protein [uncultured Draconibacterium sp.]|uniref:hypothetical protein n=1 Tax=uncultured Draconibacterium sp. TaxID=1573823 RepID=UPI0029C855B7|nr:hypothetical protein [uncultured Draconibacterium sp.]
MNYIRHQTGLFERFAEDERINPFHISLYLALFQLWNRNRFRNPFPIQREEIMFLSHIGSVNTYTRTIKQLHQWGYIIYIPSFHPSKGTKVSCINFDKAAHKGNGEANVNSGNKTDDKGADKAQYKRTNIVNNTNSIKQEHLKKNNNGKEKESTGRFHVNNDKDYSEPL